MIWTAVGLHEARVQLPHSQSLVLLLESDGRNETQAVNQHLGTHHCHRWSASKRPQGMKSNASTMRYVFGLFTTIRVKKHSQTHPGGPFAKAESLE